MLGLEMIVVLGALFGLLVYGMLRTRLTDVSVVWPSSADDRSHHQ